MDKEVNMSKRNWNRAARRAASLLVALCMLCALVPAAALAYANNGWTESVVATDENQTEQFDSVTSTEETPGGIYVWAENGHDANVTVNGAIDADYSAAYIGVNGEGSNATLKSDDVTSERNNGVDINADEGGAATVDVGDVEASNNAVIVYADDNSKV